LLTAAGCIFLLFVNIDFPASLIILYYCIQTVNRLGMKKTVLHLIFFCFLVPGAFAQWGQGKSLGYKPAPFKINHIKRPANDLRYKSGAALPAKFDLRDEGRVTSAKDQGGGQYGGNCTAFSTMGAIESRWLTMGFGEYDLAEQHMAACNGFDEENWGFGQGANQFVCSAYLTRLNGPVLESQNPYNLNVHPCLPFLEANAYVPESRWLPVRDFELLKRTIYYHGAVYAGIHWETSGAAFRDTDNTYYYDGALPPNHAVLVCGWDDNMPTAGGTGAWICKNSWSTGWADNGFFYISYQDTRFATDEMAYFPTRWDTSDVDIAYIYDEIGFTAKLPAINIDKVYELAKFIADEAQLVTHIGVAIPDPETVIDLHVYEDFDGNEPSNLIASRENIYIEIPGVYTFELPVLVDGDFFVQVTRKVSAEEANHAVETFDEGFSNPVIEQDVNWTRREGSSKWFETNVKDMGLDFNLTIRAFAQVTSAPVASFITDKQEACLGSEITFTYLENNAADSWEWDFGQDASPASASTSGPHTVTYSSEGTKTVRLIVSGAGGTDTITRYDLVDVVSAIRVNILKESIVFTQGKTAEISAYGADTYSWEPSNILDTPTGQTVHATTPSAGTYQLVVTGTQGNCTARDTVKLQTVDRPAHDDMCSAMLISPGGWIGWWFNEFATAEADEPYPKEVDCYEPLSWCRDDWNPTPVNNSLWYYFYGPPSGMVRIETNGFDNQIAVYRADTCTEITADSLIAANDDPDAQNPSLLAAKLDEVIVEPGKKYFLQVDGSFGGATGAFELLFYANPVGIFEVDPIDQAGSLSIFPNPGRDIFNILLDGIRSAEVEIFLYNLNGQVLRKKTFTGTDNQLVTRFDLSGQPGGVYHVRVIDGDRVIEGKLVKH
jgi:C1A family cysteine protease/PKD repeat protein